MPFYSDFTSPKSVSKGPANINGSNGSANSGPSRLEQIMHNIEGL